MQFQDLIDWMLTLANQYGYLGIFLISLIGALSIFFPIPYTVVIFTLGGLKVGEVWVFEPLWIAVAAGIGSAIGEISGYLIGVGGGKAISRKYKKKMDLLARVFRRYGSIVIFLFALTPLPDDLLFIPLGVMRYNVLRAFVPALIGKFCMNLIVAYSGRFSIQIIRDIFGVESDWISALIGIVLALVLLIIVFVIMFKMDWEKFLTGPPEPQQKHRGEVEDVAKERYRWLYMFLREDMDPFEKPLHACISSITRHSARRFRGFNSRSNSSTTIKFDLLQLKIRNSVLGVLWMSLRQKLRFWAPFVFFFALVIVLIFIWYFTFPASAWEDTPNYLEMYFGFVAERPVDAFLTVSTGPGGTVSWAFIPTYSLIAIHIILYMAGKRKKTQYTFLNKYYLVYLLLLGLFAISFQNASEHYGWYLNPNYTHITTGKPAPGYVDTWTHITSPWLLGALIVPFALERYVGWDRKLMWLFMFVVLAIIALGWEIGETIDVAVNPSPTYFNYPMDSLKDMIMGAGIGSILSCWIYERLVTDLGERTWASG